MMLLMKGKVEKLGRLKPDTTGSSHDHRGRLASDFSTFPFISNFYIPSLGVKVQSDAHYSSKKIISL